VGDLDRSSAAEADRHFAGFEDDWNVALIIVEREHALESVGIAQDIDILEGDVSLCVSLTGFARVRSEILAEDENFFHKINQAERDRNLAAKSLSVFSLSLSQFSVSSA